LKTIVEKQPEEVEERLKSEMDRLLKRNQEVHEDNTRLEEEMSAMEMSLVETKMKYAEVCLPLSCYSVNFSARLMNNSLMLHTRHSRGGGRISRKHSTSPALALCIVRYEQSLHGFWRE
jgi:hypothetical protein